MHYLFHFIWMIKIIYLISIFISNIYIYFGSCNYNNYLILILFIIIKFYVHIISSFSMMNGCLSYLDNWKKGSVSYFNNILNCFIFNIYFHWHISLHILSYGSFYIVLNIIKKSFRVHILWIIPFLICANWSDRFYTLYQIIEQHKSILCHTNNRITFVWYTRRIDSDQFTPDRRWSATRGSNLW